METYRLLAKVARMQPQQQPNYGYVPQQQSQVNHQIAEAIRQRDEQRRSLCDTGGIGFGLDAQLFYLHCQNSSLSPELAEAIRQRGKRVSESEWAEF